MGVKGLGKLWVLWDMRTLGYDLWFPGSLFEGTIKLKLRFVFEGPFLRLDANPNLSFLLYGTFKAYGFLCTAVEVGYMYCKFRLIWLQASGREPPAGYAERMSPKTPISLNSLGLLCCSQLCT